MLVNKDTMDTESHVEFVSYTGKWPNLCSGVLILRIDGKEAVFGNIGLDEILHYPKFWSAGGVCTAHILTHDEWEIDVKELPEEFRKYAEEIDVVFNENVEYGHCGGCR